MGFKQITISALFLAACSTGGSTDDTSPVGGTQTVDGSQTGGEGQLDACSTISITEVDADEARALGFAVDEHLALFDQTFEEPFHRGNLDCSALPPTSDGEIQVRASLQGIDLVHREPTDPDAAETCPTSERTYLQYRAVIELTTDDGTLAGSFESKAWVSAAPDHAGLVFSVDATPSAFNGSLGIRVDASRAHVGKLDGQVALGATVWESRLFTTVSYLDGAEPIQSQGDGIFWPSDFGDVNGAALCGWLDVPGQQPPPIGIDDFNDL
jgi:hypothetical protein